MLDRKNIEAGMLLNQIRYQYEFVHLPGFLLDDRAAVAAFEKKMRNGAFYMLMADLCQACGEQIPYLPEEYKVHYAEQDNIVVCVADMPQPVASVLCHQIFYVVTMVNGKYIYAYYTAENTVRQGMIVIGSTKGDGDHLNFGFYEKDNEEMLVDRVVEIFKSQYLENK